MGCMGVHFAITKALAEKLLAASGDDGRLVEIVQEEIEKAWEEDYVCETDKAWDALHRCLSNGTLNPREGQPPLNLCFFGGQVLNGEADYYVVLLTPPQVKQVAAELPNVTEAWLRDRYFSTEFPDYQVEKNDEDFQYSWDWFKGLPRFFAKAAAEERHVIFTVDQ